MLLSFHIPLLSLSNQFERIVLVSPIVVILLTKLRFQHKFEYYLNRKLNKLKLTFQTINGKYRIYALLTLWLCARVFFYIYCFRFHRIGLFMFILAKLELLLDVIHLFFHCIYFVYVANKWIYVHSACFLIKSKCSSIRFVREMYFCLFTKAYEFMNLRNSLKRLKLFLLFPINPNRLKQFSWTI